jgi:hypothetical protein
MLTARLTAETGSLGDQPAGQDQVPGLKHLDDIRAGLAHRLFLRKRFEIRHCLFQR